MAREPPHHVEIILEGFRASELYRERNQFEGALGERTSPRQQSSNVMIGNSGITGSRGSSAKNVRRDTPITANRGCSSCTTNVRIMSNRRA